MFRISRLCRVFRSLKSFPSFQLFPTFRSLRSFPLFCQFRVWRTLRSFGSFGFLKVLVVGIVQRFLTCSSFFFRFFRLLGSLIQSCLSTVSDVSLMHKKSVLSVRCATVFDTGRIELSSQRMRAGMRQPQHTTQHKLHVTASPCRCGQSSPTRDRPTLKNSGLGLCTRTGTSPTSAQSVPPARHVQKSNHAPE